MSDKILVSDDDTNILAAIKLHLKSEGFECDCVQTPEAAVHAVKNKAYSLVLADLNYKRDTTSGEEGIDLISNIRELDELIPIVAMTGWGTIDIAVSAMRSGANDFVEKPCDNNRLLTTINNHIKATHSQKRSLLLEHENQLMREQHQLKDWICESPAMKKVMTMAAKVAKSDINVLITGENGTGKSQLAQYIHDCSLRQDNAFVNVNMGAINEQVFESELFGHVKGAFTDAKNQRLGRIELADQGTLFMDEVANIPMSQQAKLLRVLESGEFEKLGSSQSQWANVRIVSATNGDLEAMVEDGAFRKDLLFRIKGIEITIPPLAERAEDIVPLAQQILAGLAHKYQQTNLSLNDDAKKALTSYHWPGNVREMQNLMERAALLAEGDCITAADLMLTSSVSDQSFVAGNDEWVDLTMEQAEEKLIHLVLDKFGGNAKEACESLGYSKSAFYRRLEKFGIHR